MLFHSFQLNEVLIRGGTYLQIRKTSKQHKNFIKTQQIIAKLLLLFFQLFKINKNIQDTLSLCVTRSGTAHSSQYFANSFKICFADRNLLTLESLSHGLCSKCTDLIEKSCTCLLSTGGSPMSFMSFVNFSQFNLAFHEFRNYLIKTQYKKESLHAIIQRPTITIKNNRP